MLSRGFGFVQPRQPAVMPLVQPPVLGHGNPQLIDRLQCNVRRTDRAGEHRGVGPVERQPLGLHQLPAPPRLRFAFRRQVYIDPAGETVVEIPLALAVAQKGEGGHGVSITARREGAWWS